MKNEIQVFQVFAILLGVWIAISLTAIAISLYRILGLLLGDAP